MMTSALTSLRARIVAMFTARAKATSANENAQLVRTARQLSISEWLATSLYFGCANRSEILHGSSKTGPHAGQTRRCYEETSSALLPQG